MQALATEIMVDIIIYVKNTKNLITTLKSRNIFIWLLRLKHEQSKQINNLNKEKR